MKKTRVKKIDGNISISRCSNGMIHISIEDNLSCMTFVVGSMTAEDFGNAVTGLSVQPISLEVCGLDVVGKKQIIEDRAVVYNGSQGSFVCRKELEKWLEKNYKEEGWIVNSYLGGQSSIEYADNKIILNFTVHKFV